MKQVRLWSATIAALMVALIGAGMLIGRIPLVGVPLMVAGLAFGLRNGIVAWKSRPDPYDLSRLWDEYEPEEPEDDDPGPLTLAYCHFCGQAVAKPHARCPDCGNTLR